MLGWNRPRKISAKTNVELLYNKIKILWNNCDVGKNWFGGRTCEKKIWGFSWYSTFYCWVPNSLLIGLSGWVIDRSPETMVSLFFVGVFCFKAHQMAIKTLTHKLKTKLFSVMMHTICIVIVWMFMYLQNSYIENLMPRASRVAQLT